METNKEKAFVNYEKLTQDEQELVKQAFDECATIFVSAVLRIEKVIDSLFEKLTKGDD